MKLCQGLYYILLTKSKIAIQIKNCILKELESEENRKMNNCTRD